MDAVVKVIVSPMLFVSFHCGYFYFYGHVQSRLKKENSILIVLVFTLAHKDQQVQFCELFDVSNKFLQIFFLDQTLYIIFPGFHLACPCGSLHFFSLVCVNVSLHAIGVLL